MRRRILRLRGEGAPRNLVERIEPTMLAFARPGKILQQEPGNGMLPDNVGGHFHGSGHFTSLSAGSGETSSRWPRLQEGRPAMSLLRTAGIVVPAAGPRLNTMSVHEIVRPPATVIKFRYGHATDCSSASF